MSLCVSGHLKIVRYFPPVFIVSSEQAMPGLLGEFPRCQGLRFLLLLHPNSFPKTCHPCPFDGEGVKSALRHVFLGQPLPTVIPIGGSTT